VGNVATIDELKTELARLEEILREEPDHANLDFYDGARMSLSWALGIECAPSDLNNAIQHHFTKRDG
jgi:hypothetical protein